jgi:hypothetical protein
VSLVCLLDRVSEVVWLYWADELPRTLNADVLSESRLPSAASASEFLRGGQAACLSAAKGVVAKLAVLVGASLPTRTMPFF